MIFPVRCFACGKVIGHLYQEYLELTAEYGSSAEALKKLNIDRMCCRRMFIGHVELIDEIIRFGYL